jgi:hypothetical protein
MPVAPKQEGLQPRCNDKVIVTKETKSKTKLKGQKSRAAQKLDKPCKSGKCDVNTKVTSHIKSVKIMFLTIS